MEGAISLTGVKFLVSTPFSLICSRCSSWNCSDSQKRATSYSFSIIFDFNFLLIPSGDKQNAVRARFHLSLKIIATTEATKERTKHNNKKNLSNISVIEKFPPDTLNGAAVAAVHRQSSHGDDEIDVELSNVRTATMRDIKTYTTNEIWHEGGGGGTQTIFHIIKFSPGIFFSP